MKYPKPLPEWLPQAAGKQARPPDQGARARACDPTVETAKTAVESATREDRFRYVSSPLNAKARLVSSILFEFLSLERCTELF